MTSVGMRAIVEWHLMKAVLLAGGLGTRLSEETGSRPKPMVEIGGKPILWHIMKIYSAHGINDFVICLGYKGYVIKEYFANYFLHSCDVTFDMKCNKMQVHKADVEPWTVTLVETGDETQIGGRIKRVLPYLAGDDAFCLTYGDGVGNVNITKTIEQHREQRLACNCDGHAAAGPFWRVAPRGRSGHRVPGEATRRWRMDQRRVLRAVAEGRRLHRGRRDRMGARADGKTGSGGPTRRLLSRWVLAADGYAA